jgi:hypothetical protein
MKFSKYIVSTLFVIGFECTIFVLSVVVLALNKPGEHVFTCIGFGLLSSLMSLPFIIAALFVNIRFKVIIIPIATFISIAISLLFYYRVNRAEEAFKRIVMSPLPESLEINNSQVDDVIAFLEFTCKKDDMKKILDFSKFEKTATKYGWGERAPKWINQQRLAKDYELLVKESVGNCVRAIYLNKDSTNAFYIMYWY